MQSRQTVHIMSAEWRWVIIVGSALVLLAFSPLLWVALRGTPGWQFMGVLHNYQDGATYISKMRLGYEGNWLVYFQHTPEPHSGAFIQVHLSAAGASRAADRHPADCHVPRRARRRGAVHVRGASTSLARRSGRACARGGSSS